MGQAQLSFILYVLLTNLPLTSRFLQESRRFDKVCRPSRVTCTSIIGPTKDDAPVTGGGDTSGTVC